MIYKLNCCLMFSLLAYGRLPGVETFLQFCIADGEVAYIRDLIADVLKVEVDERRNLWFFLHDRCI